MKTMTLTAAALAAFATAPAIASETTTVFVETADLDLTDRDDLSRLDNRIETAIRRNCRTGGRALSDLTAERQCRADLREAASQAVRIAVSKARESRLALLNLNPGA